MAQQYIDLQGHVYSTIQTGSTILILDLCSGNLLISFTAPTGGTVQHLLLAMMWTA